MNIAMLREQLKIDEGVKYEVYEDHLGYKTFGIGHLITAKDPEYTFKIGHKISETRVNEAFDNDVSLYIREAKKVFSNLEKLPEEAQQVIVNMCFNMGAPRLGKFKKFISAINNENYETAAIEMLDSRWANQVGDRAVRLSKRISAIPFKENSDYFNNEYMKYNK